MAYKANTEYDEYVIHLVKEGLHASEIARQLSLTPSQIQNKLKRLGLTAQPKPLLTMEDYKACYDCKQKLKRKEFPPTKGGKCVNSRCRDCYRIYKRNYRKQTKNNAVQYKGGCCQLCGFDRLSALDFHHLDPSQKDFTIGERREGNFDNLKKELDKCVLVCANCHRLIHSGDIIL